MVVGIICPPGWNRGNWPLKIWGKGQCPPAPLFRRPSRCGFLRSCSTRVASIPNGRQTQICSGSIFQMKIFEKAGPFFPENKMKHRNWYAEFSLFSMFFYVTPRIWQNEFVLLHLRLKVRSLIILFLIEKFYSTFQPLSAEELNVKIIWKLRKQ